MAVIIYTTGDGKAYTAGDGTLLVIQNPMLLVVDRTSEDVDRWKELKAKGWARMTAGERLEWSSPMKGAYNHTDLNRVEEAVQYLADRLTANGFRFYPEVKTSWTPTDYPSEKDMERYYGNVKAIRGLISVYSTTPPAPTTDKRLNYQMANDLEKILVDVNDLLDKMEKTWLYSGDIFCGEV